VILAKEAFKNKVLFSGVSMFFTLQFGVSYYTIFEVDWLGWDLVEPLTYTSTQGMSIAGLWFLYRKRHDGTEYSQLTDYMKKKRQQKWFVKHKIDLQRIEFLKHRIVELDSEIE
jgi:hypothetical protein